MVYCKNWEIQRKSKRSRLAKRMANFQKRLNLDSLKSLSTRAKRRPLPKKVDWSASGAKRWSNIGKKIWKCASKKQANITWLQNLNLTRTCTSNAKLTSNRFNRIYKNTNAAQKSWTHSIFWCSIAWWKNMCEPTTSTCNSASATHPGPWVLRWLVFTKDLVVARFSRVRWPIFWMMKHNENIFKVSKDWFLFARKCIKLIQVKVWYREMMYGILIN